MVTMRVKIEGRIIEANAVCAYIEKLVKIDESYQLLQQHTSNDCSDINCLKFFNKQNKTILAIRNLPNQIVRNAMDNLLADDYFDFDFIFIRGISMFDYNIKQYVDGKPFYVPTLPGV